MTNPESQAEREAFEAAAETLGIPNNSVLAWELWQKAWDRRAELPPELTVGTPEGMRVYAKGYARGRKKGREDMRQSPVAAASPSGQSHPYERDLAGLTEFIDAMCAGDSKSMALVQSAWYRCMARNHPANQVAAAPQPPEDV